MGIILSFYATDMCTYCAEGKMTRSLRFFFPASLFGALQIKTCILRGHGRFFKQEKSEIPMHILLFLNILSMFFFLFEKKYCILFYLNIIFLFSSPNAGWFMFKNYFIYA